jgi:hypothetical protein
MPASKSGYKSQALHQCEFPFRCVDVFLIERKQKRDLLPGKHLF